MVNTRKSSQSQRLAGKAAAAAGQEEEAARRDDGSDGSLSDSHISPPAKRTLKHADSVRKDKSKSRTTGQREEWSVSTGQSRLNSQSGATLPNGRNLSLKSCSLRGEKKGDGDHACINGGREIRKSCRSRKNRFESLNQSLLFDQLVNSTAEAVLQEMDNINIRRNRRSGEVERLRMWTDTEFENMDMYSRVKRRRKSLRRNSYGIQNHHEVSTEGEEEESQEEDGDIEVEEAEGEENDRPYNLRQRKTVERYQAPPIVPAHQKKRENALFDIHRSPARRSHIRRKKHAIHSSDTTSSDEERFERRKSKSMARARNRCLPMNFRAEDLASGILRERVKVGASLADVDPMILDKSVRFDSIGGLSNHIHALKEMVVFPLLYPEIFEKFKIQPPRGCLFYGPPGTGKTLVARALANECTEGERKVAFFMRKGADCLSKWVGESERQLRLLFDQAYLMRPSIIFFDEIDGLAPVRSSRQDQIHSSIVSTLLALMDGLDNRGEIVVIGATNRLDSIDPALRRPGRFDREFLFSLPDQKARKHILQIHTRDWNPKLSDHFLEELAEECVGYCGADIKALCTEAALIALRRRYPQIYASSQKLQLDVSSIVLSAQDFYHAMQNIVPASQRAILSSGHALSPIIRPLLERTFNDILAVLHRVFPHSEISQGDKREDATNLILDDSEDENVSSIFETSCQSGSPKKQLSAAIPKPYLHFTMSAYHQPTSYRPRLLLSGERDSGQTSHLAPALLHSLEKIAVHRLDLPALYSVSAKTPEESCAQIFREARRTLPSIVYMPHIGDWWETVSETVRATFLTLLQDIPSFSPIFLLSTSETMYSELPEEVKCIFKIQYEEVFYIQRPSEEDRRKFFQELVLNQASMPPPRRKQIALSDMEVLPLALPSPTRQMSEAEKQRMEDQEENTLRELRLFLRDVTKRLATDKRFNIFSKPVDIEEVSDYLEVIKEPMDLSTVITKIDKHNYLTTKDFLIDIDLICSNALEYNPDKDPGDKIIRHRACTLKDTAHAIIAAELDPEFNKMCEEIKEARKKRGLSVTAEQITPHGSSVQKTETRVEEAFQSKQKNAMALWHSSANKCAFRLRRKSRRRSQWGKGIIKKRKVNNLKKDDDDAKFADDENQGEDNKLMENGELEGSTDCIEENGEEAGDLFLTNDESSCDIMDIHGEQRLNNGTVGKENSIPSTEESSNESLLVNTKIDMNVGKESKEESLFKRDCLNGEASTVPIPTCQYDKCESSNAVSPSGITDTSTLRQTATTDDYQKENPEASSDSQEVEQIKHPGNEAAHCSNNEKKPQGTDVETKETESDKEGTFKNKKLRKVALAQVPEEQDLVPPVVVDHGRLMHLLDLLVKKSDNLTVDQLERLYSLLNQCIYRHRKDYDKTQLVEEMERTVHMFETFL